MGKKQTCYTLVTVPQDGLQQQLFDPVGVWILWFWLHLEQAGGFVSRGRSPPETPGT